MKRSLLAVLLTGIALTVSVQATSAAGTTSAPAMDIVMPGDDALDCAGIRKQIGLMEDMIVSSNETQKSAQNTGTGISIAKAIGGFLIGSIPGAIGVMAAGHVAGEAAENKAETAEEHEDIAGQRRSMMIGMYNAKGCKGPIHSGRAMRNAAIPEDTAPRTQSTATYGQPESIKRFDPAAIEPAAGGQGYKIDAHKVRYND